MERGRLVTVGTHDELIECSGVYARLWDSCAGQVRSLKPD